MLATARRSSAAVDLILVRLFDTWRDARSFCVVVGVKCQDQFNRMTHWIRPTCFFCHLDAGTFCSEQCCRPTVIGVKMKIKVVAGRHRRYIRHCSLAGFEATKRLSILGPRELWRPFSSLTEDPARQPASFVSTMEQ